MPPAQMEDNGSLSAPPDYEATIDACPHYDFYNLSAPPARRKVRPTLDMLRNAEPVRKRAHSLVREKSLRRSASFFIGKDFLT